MKISKILLLLPIFLVIATSAEAQLPDKVKCFPVSQVRLTESPFKHAQDLDICYLLGLDPDRLLAPYRKEAGVPPKAPNYGNWETAVWTDISEVIIYRLCLTCTQQPAIRR